MKFTELHIAVVTFHPLEFIFPFLILSYAFFRGSGERAEREKTGKEERREGKK